MPDFFRVYSDEYPGRAFLIVMTDASVDCYAMAAAWGEAESLIIEPASRAGGQWIAAADFGVFHRPSSPRASLLPKWRALPAPGAYRQQCAGDVEEIIAATNCGGSRPQSLIGSL